MRRVLALLCLIAVPLSARGDVVHRTLAPGVELSQETIEPPDGPLVVNVLRVNPKAPGVRIQAALSKDVIFTDDPTQGRETVGSIAVRHGAIAAVNADFFPYTGDPLGIAIRDGELLSEGMPQRVAFGLTADGQAVFDTLLSVGTLTAADGAIAGLDGINRPVGKDEIVIETPAFGARVRAGESAIMVPLAGVNLPVKVGQDEAGVVQLVSPAEPSATVPGGGAVLVGSGHGAEWLRAHVRTGDTARFRFDYVSNPLAAGPPRGDLLSRASGLRGRITKSAWTDVQQAVGGGPWLVRDGKVAVDGVEEGFSPTGFVNARHPRTAVGVTASGEVLIVTADGRQSFSKGLSLPELAAYMVKLGAAQAINLDGGGSTTMYARGLYVNGPSDGEPNAIADALLVYADMGRDNAEREAIAADPITVRAGEKADLRAKLPADCSDSDVFWGTKEGRGFVDQRGVLIAPRTGTGTVIVQAGTKEIRIPYTVIGASAARIKASFQAVANNPPDRNSLVIVVTDAYGNPVAGQTVSIKVVGGMADEPTINTDGRGRATVEIVWDAAAPRRAILTCGALAPITVTAK